MTLSSEDERLRRESPAYQPDAGWDELEPQAMNVVLSIRFDARAARRLHDLARDAGRAPGQLIRDWTMERLAALSSDAEPAAAREATAPYDTTGNRYESLRQRYRPNRIDILLVGESRPAGRTFFYLANSNLYYATHEAFQRALGPMPPAEDFLRYLQQHGVWLYDLADTPVDRMKGRPRRSVVQARAGELVALLRETKPRLIVAIKKNLAATVRLALDEAGIPSDRLRVLPFPLYQWRAEYVESLSRLLSAEVQPHRR